MNLALFALWVGVTKGRLGEAEIAAAAGLSARWGAAVVHPLRAARRALKPGVDGVPYAVSEPLRTRIKGLELEAERLQQQALAGLAARVEPPPGVAAADANFKRCLDVAGLRPEVVDADWRALLKIAATAPWAAEEPKGERDSDA